MVSPENTNWLFDYGLIDDIPVPDGNFQVSSSGFNWPVQTLNGSSSVRYNILRSPPKLDFLFLKFASFCQFCVLYGLNLIRVFVICVYCVKYETWLAVFVDFGDSCIGIFVPTANSEPLFTPMYAFS